jgi:HD-like signal output (HDOD) protein
MTSRSISPTSPEATLELLWRRMRERGNLPGFSKVIKALANAAQKRDEHDRSLGLTKTILSDPALTQRVLRLANSAMYAVFGKGINTVSKAVLVLGTESIGHLALGMKLIEDLSAIAASSDSARSEMEKAVLAGHIARQVSSSSLARDDEEAVVCSLLHNLGKMMVTFYLPEQWETVQERKAGTIKDEKKIANEVLGLELDEISGLIAERWKLPRKIVDTLRDVPPGTDPVKGNRAAWLATISTMSSRCAEVIHERAGDSDILTGIAQDYAEMLGIETKAICAAVKKASVMAEEDAASLYTPGAGDPRVNAAPAAPAAPAASDRRRNNAAEILFRGVADMTGAGRQMGTGHLLTIALETVHQGLSANSAIAFLRNRAQSQYVARMVLGEDSEGKLSNLTFSDRFEPDVFHAALASDKVVFVENARHPIFSSKLPKWWRSTMENAQSFVILPLVVNRQPVGFIYGDWTKNMADSRLDEVEIATLNELRTLIVESMAQRL